MYVRLIRLYPVFLLQRRPQQFNVLVVFHRMGIFVIFLLLVLKSIPKWRMPAKIWVVMYSPSIRRRSRSSLYWRWRDKAHVTVIDQSFILGIRMLLLLARGYGMMEQEVVLFHFGKMALTCLLTVIMIAPYSAATIPGKLKTVIHIYNFPVKQIPL